MASRLGLAGVNLTIPLKERALELMDILTPAARRAGAVNTVSFMGGRMEGHSTDGEGFLQSLAAGWGWSSRGARVVVLGAGGAARSVAFALADAGARRIMVVNRSPARAAALARSLGDWRAAGRGLPSRAADWRLMLANADLLVNATPIGMHGGPSPVPAGALARGLAVADLVYNPARTALLLAARARGCRAQNGEGMLVQQGALALERWTHRRAPVEVMRGALREALNTLS